MAQTCGIAYVPGDGPHLLSQERFDLHRHCERDAGHDDDHGPRDTCPACPHVHDGVDCSKCACRWVKGYPVGHFSGPEMPPQ